MLKQQLLAKLSKLHELYHSGALGEVVHEIYPQLDKSSRVNYLYFTMAPSINFQRDSKRMWQSAFATFNDDATNFVFDPLKVIEHDRTQIQKALLKHKLALLKEKHTDIWMKISSKLAKDFQGDPRELLKFNNHDVVETIAYLKSNKKDFPYLNGPKMSNYWLFILSQFTNVKLKNTHEISIIPDTHIKQATIKLGLLKESELSPKSVESVWKELLKGSEFVPMQLHAPLWRWSKNKFKPRLLEL